MPWLAIPFSDYDTRHNLHKLFKVNGIPHLMFLDADGTVSCDDGIRLIKEYGTEAYPFTVQKINELTEQEERAKREQSLKSLLVTDSRDFVISSDGKKVYIIYVELLIQPCLYLFLHYLIPIYQVPVWDLEGKTVGLYFWSASYEPATEFTSKLVEVYNILKERGESFEIVLLSLGDDEEGFKQGLDGMPWLAVPFKDKCPHKLDRHFELLILPTLVIIGPDGKTLKSNVVEAIKDHGAFAFPFTSEKFEELAAIEKAWEEAQTLESILVSGDLNYVIGRDDVKV